MAYPMFRVSRKMFMLKTKSLFEAKSTDPVEQDGFVRSPGWLEKFMKRNAISLGRRTTVAQKDPSLMIEKLVAYILHAHAFNANSSM